MNWRIQIIARGESQEFGPMPSVDLRNRTSVPGTVTRHLCRLNVSWGSIKQVCDAVQENMQRACRDRVEAVQVGGITVVITEVEPAGVGV